jgi:hypothetical protein
MRDFPALALTRLAKSTFVADHETRRKIEAMVFQALLNFEWVEASAPKATHMLVNR